MQQDSTMRLSDVSRFMRDIELKLTIEQASWLGCIMAGTMADEDVREKQRQWAADVWTQIYEGQKRTLTRGKIIELNS